MRDYDEVQKVIDLGINEIKNRFKDDIIEADEFKLLSESLNVLVMTKIKLNEIY